MNQSEWDRAKSLLAEAAELPAADREGYMTEHCPDPELRREILEMLASPASLSAIITAGALAPGDRLGPYVVDRLLGRGGMGVVYRARDTRLERFVALKVLPPQLSADPVRRERFDREARAVAALHDPHICTLYDIGRDDDVNFLVMEYLDGETLASRVARGRLPVDDALTLALDIVGALDRAHRAGVVHRDLKPANIMVTKAGAVLLDFGLARLSAAPISEGASIAATMPPVTAEGTLIGTLSYMAPEQLEGRDADARSDVWAFGCVLYEMLTGTRAFEGESHASLIAAIMSGTPAGLAERVPAAPPSIDWLVRACLAKNRDDRFQSSHDVLIALQWLREADTRPAPHITDATRRNGRRSLVGAAVGVIVAATAALGYLAVRPSPPPDASPAVRFDLQPPSGWRFEGAPAISPDGRHVVATASNDKGAGQLWLRTLDEEDGRFLPGTEKAAYPFWAPDSRAVAFFADDKLKRLDIRNLSTMTICDAPNPRGGAWTSDNQIVFAPGISSALVRVPAAGGDPVPLTTLAADRGERGHRFPSPAPNGRLTYHVMNRNGDENGTWLVSLDDPHHGRRIVRAFARAIVADDRLFWTTTAGTLLTQRLDLSTGGLLGEPATVVTGVNSSSGVVQGLSAFSISTAGALVFQGSSPPATQLAWVARNGRTLESVSDVGFNLNPQLSPDGGRVAYVRREQGRSDLWVVDVERRSPIRVLSEQTQVPIRDLFWSRDGSRIVYSSDRGPKATNLYVISAAGGQAAPFFEQPNDIYFYGWIPDAQTAIWEEQADATRVTGQVGNRFAIKTMGPDQKPVTYFDPGYWILHTTVSPNGRWIAFSSDQSGPRDVFVIGFPEPGTPRQVSSAGGTQPRWRADGKELFFLSADSKLMAVSVNTVHGDVTFGRPEPLFDVPMRWWLNSLSTQYDVSPDGQRFLVDMVREEHVAPLTVMLNWLEELKQRAPTR